VGDTPCLRGPVTPGSEMMEAMADVCNYSLENEIVYRPIVPDTSRHLMNLFLKAHRADTSFGGRDSFPLLLPGHDLCVCPGNGGKGFSNPCTSETC
jgi:hypothetical protein